MNQIFKQIRELAENRAARWIGGPVVLAAAAATILSHSQVTPPPSPVAISLSADPLYARGQRAKPTLTLALSVEFPTVGAQYVGSAGASSDSSYLTSDEYIGYFDAGSCYTYSNGSTANDRYFIRSGPATNHECGGSGFSGNFMNWATSSAIDILRFGLTGGDRIIDTSTLTVLQRAVLPNTGVSNNFWNGSNFPSKVLTAALAPGAVPSGLRGGHTGDIYVANCLNRVHFGTQATGNCGAPGNNSNLGVPSGTGAVGVVSDYSGSLPLDFVATPCAFENGTCSIAGTLQVAYGSGANWKFMTVNANVGCNNATFGDPIVGTAKACFTRTAPVVVSSGLTADAFFYSRVRVCESDTDGRLLDPRSGLCARYPSGNFKPVGNLQKSADDIRVAAFGYLNDGSLDRYGGVLRAPMKYVGPRSYDSNFALSQSANPVQEWDTSTGVFLRNPDSSILPSGTPVSGTGSNWPGQQMSGVVNYLNQFGRTGTYGQYKTYDPVGELYYESLRYLQGLPPTSGNNSATSPTYGINDSMRDGFPVYENWLTTSVPDPHPAVSGMTDYSCVKNNIVAIGDVNTHADKYIPGNTRVSSGDAARSANAANNEPNFYDWTRVVGAFEEARSVSYVDGAGATRTTSNFNTPSAWSPDLEDATPGCCNNNSYYMTGVSYWAHTHDIRGTGWTGNVSAQRPGMRVKTYILDVNEYGNQNDVTTRRRNQFYLAAKYGGFDDSPTARRPGIGNPYINVAPAGSSSPYINSNTSWERDTSVAAKQEAKTYFLSSSASEVIASLNQIFEDVTREARSIAGAAVSTQQVVTTTGYIYQAQFNTTDWSGNLVPVSISASAGVLSIGNETSSPWRNSANLPVGAAGILDDRNIASAPAATSDPRSIYVGYYSGSGTPTFNSQLFQWTGLDASIRQALRHPGYPASAAYETGDTNASLRLDYLVGDRANEGVFRRRGSRLGDIVNSGVVYSGAPVNTISGTAYATFRTTNINRAKALFVGANDGMLHAFNADTGREMFAYIPSWLVPKLSALTHPSYIHQSYQDATPAVAEVNLGTTSSQNWHTVLVSGSGGGGQGVFALDVTNPGSFGNSSILWEFTDRDDSAMGNVIGRPQLLKINIGTPTAPDFRAFAVVASGINNHISDGRASSGEPALFFLRLDKAKSAAWVEGTGSGANYFKIVFPRLTTATLPASSPTMTIASGMVGFTALTGAADQVSYIYAGDLQGNLWKINMSAFSASVAPAINNFSYYRNSSGVAVPMFTAVDSSGNRQPITMEPSLASANNRNVIVSFGTGKFLEAADNVSPYRNQTVYALLDNNSPALDSSSTPIAAISGRGRLMAGTASAANVTVPSFTWGRPLVDNSTLSRSGWYFDFYDSLTTGERQIGKFQIFSGKLIFGSIIPAVGACGDGGGNTYVVDIESGLSQITASTVGILSTPIVVQTSLTAYSGYGTGNGTGRITSNTSFGVASTGAGGIINNTPSLTLQGFPGRLSWREIVNYQELRSASW